MNKQKRAARSTIHIALLIVTFAMRLMPIPRDGAHEFEQASIMDIA